MIQDKNKNRNIMPKFPLLSVIVPIYNSEKYLYSCVKSILSQTYVPLELILVNDGSTDSSLRICTEIAQQEERIILIDQHNAGPNAARNRGLKAAHGEFVVFVDSDDEFYSNDTLALNMDMFTENPDIDIVSFPQYREISQERGALQNKKQQFTRQILFDKLTMLTNWYNGKLIDGHFPGKIFRKKLFDGWKLTESIRFTEDHYDIPNICRRCNLILISGVGGYVYKFNPYSAIHTKYTPEKRRGQLYSELNIYNYLCELKAPDKFKEDLYNRAIENAYYLSLSKYAQEAIDLIGRVPIYWHGGSNFIKLMKLFTTIFGFKFGFNISKTIAAIFLKFN